MDITLTSSVPESVQAELAATSLQITIPKLIERINRKVAHKKQRMRTSRASGGLPGLYQLLQDGKPIMTFDDVDLKQVALDVGALRDWEGGFEIIGRSGAVVASKLRQPRMGENVDNPATGTSHLSDAVTE